MSLALAAKHLESQGRGKDTHLVHMTPNELKALNKLSLDHLGQPLSKNPKTGLPEAGFLDAIVPTVLGVAGAAMGIPTPLLVGGIGLATYAITGDIGQGIMAGLGAWSGQQLGADISKAGASAAQNAAHTGGNVALEVAENYVNPALVTNASTGALSSSFAPGVGGLANTTLGPGASIGNFTNAYSGANAGISGTGLKAMDVVQQNTAAQAQNVADAIKTGSQSQAAPWYTSEGFKANTSQFGRGWDAVKADPMKFVKENTMDVASAASPLLFSALEPPTYNPVTKEEENPFGLKRITKDFQGSFPTQPNPYYTAQYPDYTARPYGAANGGLMDVNSYAKGKKVDYSKAAKSAQDLESGVLMATRRPVVDTPIPDVGIYADERKYASMDPYERALSMLKDIKGASGISSRGLPNLKGMPTLGTISTDPAMVEAELAEQAKRQIVQEAKRGGLMDGHLGDYSDGGRLLKGPGDGVSDSIPATIGGKQAARLAEGEFVIPARIVSELGNGSTDAGAKRLYAMMDRIKAKRKKAKDIAADTKAYKLLPA